MNVLRMEKSIGGDAYTLYCEERDADIVRLAIKVGYVIVEKMALKEEHVCDDTCEDVFVPATESPKEEVAEKTPVEESPEPEVLKAKKAPARRVTKSKK